MPEEIAVSAWQKTGGTFAFYLFLRDDIPLPKLARLYLSQVDGG